MRDDAVNLNTLPIIEIYACAECPFKHEDTEHGTISCGLTKVSLEFVGTHYHVHHMCPLLKHDVTVKLNQDEVKDGN